MTANLLIPIGITNGWIQTQSIAGGLLKRKHAHGNVLSQGNCTSVMENGQKIPAETTGMRYKICKFDKPDATMEGSSRLLRSNRKY